MELRLMNGKKHFKGGRKKLKSTVEGKWGHPLLW
jgi:hypothetical protein